MYTLLSIVRASINTKHFFEVYENTYKALTAKGSQLHQLIPNQTHTIKFTE